MPHINLKQLESTVRNQLRRNSLASGLFITAAASLLIPAFSVGGTRFDYTLFCFNPPQLTNPEQHDYCTGEKIRRGITWRVAQEAANNQEFASKVSILKSIPAQNPHAGLYGLGAAAFLGTAYGFFKWGTQRLEDNIDIFIWNKKSLILERAFQNEMHLSIEAQRRQNEEEFIREMMTREHGAALLELMSDQERQLAAERYAKGEKLDEANFELQLATLKAQAAEQLEKETRHRVEAEKLNKQPKKKDSGIEPTGNEAARSELIEKLKAHEDGWLYELCTGFKPLWILGDMGSWKSYCAATIALTRYHLEGWKIESLTDPHLHQNRSKAWKQLIPLEPELFGTGQNWENINDGLQAAFDRWATREEDKDPIITSIWDEMTNYAKHEECAKAASEFSGRAVSDPRKAAEGIILIAHAFTNTTTGGSEGYAEAREGNSIQLRLTSTNKMKPTFKGKLTGFKNQDGEVLEGMPITIPVDWFNPEAIAKLFTKEGK
jgi:hypothetical protein